MGGEGETKRLTALFDGSAWAPSPTPPGLPRSKPSRSVPVLNASFWGFHWSGGGERRGGLPCSRDRKTCQYFNHWTEKQARRKLSFQNTFFFFNPHHESPHLLPAGSQGLFALGLCLLLPYALLKAAVTTSRSPQHWLTPCLSTGPEQAICPQSTLVYGFRYKRQVFMWHTVSRKMSCFIHSVINHYAKCFMLSTKSRLQREMNYGKSKSITGKERRVVSQACSILPAA